MDALPQPLLLLGEDSRIGFANLAAAKLVGSAPEAMVGKTLKALIDLHCLAGPPQLADGRGAQSTKSRMYELIRRDGERHVVQFSRRRAELAPGYIGSVVTMVDCTQHYERLSKLEEQSSSDYLTSLVNRREFERRLARVVQRAASEPGCNALIFIDLDNFKSVNDRLGHLAGDYVLKQVADVLAKGVRERDTLARLGGDEFGLLMEHCPLSEGLSIANVLQSSLGRHRFVWQDHELRITASMGLTAISADNAEIELVWSEADNACYDAKHNGGNQVCAHARHNHVLTGFPNQQRASAVIS